MCFSMTPFYRQQNNSRKRLKRASKPAADKCDGIAPDKTPPFTEEDTQTEEVHEDAQHFHSNVEDFCHNTKVNLLSYNLLLYFCVNTILMH